MRVLIVVVLILVVSGFLGIVKAQQESPYLYTYLAQIGTNGNQFIIEAIDPVNPNQPIEIRRFSLQGVNFSVTDVLLSPNDDWLALVNQNRQVLRANFINLFTGEIHNLLVSIPSELGFASVPQHDFEWSPDGTYFAMNVIQDMNIGGFDLSSIDMMLFAPASGQIINLTNDDYQQSNFAWSSDGNQIAIYGGSWQTSEDILSVYNVQTRSVTTSTQIGLWGDYESICQLSWSPDGRYLIYREACSGRAFVDPEELYIYDLANNTIEQITHNFDESLNLETPPDVGRGANYLTLWYDANTLLIRQSWGWQRIVEQGAETTERDSGWNITLYHTASGQSIILNEDFWVEGWLLSPTSAQIAFTTNDNDLHLASLENNALLVMQSYAIEVCDLNWSPDGLLLSSGCTDSLAFIRPTTNEIIEHNFSDEFAIFQMGWIENTQ